MQRTLQQDLRKYAKGKDAANARILNAVGDGLQLVRLDPIKGPSARLASSRFFSPRDLDISAFTPTAILTAKPIRRFCTGWAREIAVTALSEMREM